MLFCINLQLRKPLLCMRDFEACQKTILMIWLIHFSNLLASNLFEKREWKDTLGEQKGEKNYENYRNKKILHLLGNYPWLLLLLDFQRF